jgi:hypothetical protein
MKSVVIVTGVLFLSIVADGLQAERFGIAENALSEFGAIRYENVYTKVPTSGKLVSLRITDAGRIYYICREESGYVVYHLKIRPMKGFEQRLQKELSETGQQWDSLYPDELLLTKQRSSLDVRRKLHKYCEAVWVRNEIVIPSPSKKGHSGQ